MISALPFNIRFPVLPSREVRCPVHCFQLTDTAQQMRSLQEIPANFPHLKPKQFTKKLDKKSPLLAYHKSLIPLRLCFIFIERSVPLGNQCIRPPGGCLKQASYRFHVCRIPLSIWMMLSSKEGTEYQVRKKRLFG